jgi:site-specific DNA recombinase
MRLGLYARVSTEKQERQKTIESQLAGLRSFADDGHHTVVEEYVDDGYSGELLDRPDLDRLRDDVRKGLMDGVAVDCSDRPSRKFAHLCLLKDEFAKCGVKMIYLNRPDRKDTPEDQLLENVEGVIAEYEKAKILERTRRGKLHKAKSGILLGGRAPYGYRYVPGERNKNSVGHYEIVSGEAEIVRLIFRLFVEERMSIRGIAKELTRRGIAPRRGKRWRTSTISRILRNEIYVGITYYNKHARVEPRRNGNHGTYKRTKNTSTRLRPKDQWIRIDLPEDLRIIDRRTFDQAQKQLAVNSRLSARNTKYQYLLRGLAKCGDCDSPLHGVPWRGRLYYRCGNRDRTFPLPKECHASAVRAAILERAVWDKVAEAIRNPQLIMRQISKLKDRHEGSKNIIRRDLDSIDRSLKNTGREESRLLDAYRESIISMDQLRDQMSKIQDKKKRLHEERAALLAKLENGRSQKVDMNDVEQVCKTISARLDTIRDNFEAKRFIMTLLVSRIVVQGMRVRISAVMPTHFPQQESAKAAHIAFPSSR